ncbi:hypothetical protein [Flexivirga lutea]
MASSGPQQRTYPAEHRLGGHYRGFLALLIALVIGAIGGGALVAFFGGSDQVAVPASSGGGSAGTSPSPSSLTGQRSATSSADVQLSQSCLRVVQDARDAYAALRELDHAATNLDAAKLDDAVQQAQQLRRRLGIDLPGCHVGVQLPGPAVSPEPTTR